MAAIEAATIPQATMMRASCLGAPTRYRSMFDGTSKRM